jgi:hypothetical protein
MVVMLSPDYESLGKKPQGTISVYLYQFRLGAWITLNMLAIFLKPLILRARSARKIKGFRKMAKVLLLKTRFSIFESAAPQHFQKLNYGFY